MGLAWSSARRLLERTFHGTFLTIIRLNDHQRMSRWTETMVPAEWNRVIRGMRVILLNRRGPHALPGPRDCTYTGDHTAIWCFFAAGCTQHSGQFIRFGRPSVPELGPGRFQHRDLEGASAALQLVRCRDGTHRINTQSSINVVCYAPIQCHVHLQNNTDL